MKLAFLCRCWLGLLLLTSLVMAQEGPLPGTKPLEVKTDITSDLVAGVDKFLLRELANSSTIREEFWAGDDADAILKRNRDRLKHIIGLREARVAFDGPTLVASTRHSSLVASTDQIEVHQVRWPAFRDVWAEGLLLTPKGKIVADVIAIPDADVAPEEIAGVTDSDLTPYAKYLAANGCRVLVPTLLSRRLEKRNGRANLTDREYIYRSAYELGRHLIGYEVQMVLAGVDWFEAESKTTAAPRPIGVAGWGEGGMLALYAGAVDSRISSIAVSGYVDDRTGIWDQPVDRNVFGLLERFGDGELLAMGPKSIVVEAAQGPRVQLPSEGGAPADLKSPKGDAVVRQVARGQHLAKKLGRETTIELLVSGDGQGASLKRPTLDAFLKRLTGVAGKADLLEVKVHRTPDGETRRTRLIHSMDRHNQWLLRESPFVRNEFMNKLDTSSVEKYEETVEWYRNYYRHEVIGSFGQERLPFNARARVAYEKEKWIGYEIVLDVYDDVIAYGVLLVPRDIGENEKRPVVVCQHGLEGRPQDIIEGDQRAYHDFAAKLAERGFVVFAPQNLYIFRDRFRTLQRKAYPIKKTLFSIIVPQHQQIVDWLKTLPYVNNDEIGFYGLSYGGKSAMRIPPLVTDYKLSICSADFNEWVGKNASTRHNFSYVWTGEYEIFEWDLGSTFNYAEMAALICPRPFMVERGHFDGVGKDEWVGYEFGKVRHLYAARLGIPDRCEIEWFYGPYKGIHTINGQGTYNFLHKHLNWPKPK
jgi:dienelactone hydrolase